MSLNNEACSNFIKCFNNYFQIHQTQMFQKIHSCEKIISGKRVKKKLALL